MPKKTEKRVAPSNRRHKKDWISQAIPLFGVICWFFALMSLAFLDRGQAFDTGSCLSIFDPALSNEWGSSSVTTALIILIATFGVCVAGFILNTLRHKRKTDRYNKSILIVGGITLAAIIAVLVYFYPYS